MQIFDAHLDLALNGVDWNRDLRRSVDDIRAEEQARGMRSPGRGTNTLSLPELQAAEVRTCLATLLARREPNIDHDFGWSSKHACYAIAHAHYAYYRALEQDGYVRILRSRSELENHRLELASPDLSPPLGLILTMEGADPLLTCDSIYEFHQLGLRAIGLTHYGDNRYGGGTESQLGLADRGRELLTIIEKLKMALDLTHLSDKSFEQVLEQFGGRVHASHQNSKRLANWQRQFSDAQYLQVIQRDGVIGIAFDIIMLQDGYVRGKSERKATLSDAVENIDIVCQLAGDALHVGIGSDLDGGYGAEQTPRDLDRMRDLQQLVPLLEKRGYSAADIESIFFGNWFRFFSEVLPD